MLVSIAAHDQLALRSVNRDGLHLGDKAQGPFEGGDAALIMQAPTFRRRLLGIDHLRQGNCPVVWR